MELLRLRDLLKWLRSDWISGFSRDELERWEAAGVIHPFRKHTRAKAIYRKWEFKNVLKKLNGAADGAQNLNLNREPEAKLLRRGDVTAWLGVTKAEVDSWSPCVIHPIRKRKNSKARYRKSEIKRNVLGIGL